MSVRRFAIVAAVLTLATVAPVAPAVSQTTLTTEHLGEGLTPSDLVAALVGEGVEFSGVSYTGVAHAAGTFGGGDGIIGFDQGVILGSGQIADVVGPNESDSTTTNNGSPGHAGLTALGGKATFDAAVLAFDFVPDADEVFFQYVFTSEEYNEFVNSNFDDVFAFFVNGSNCAMVDEDRVSINTINGGNPFGTNATRPELYRNNDLNDGGATIDTEMDGLTVVLTCQSAVEAGESNHIELAIADATDSSLDSNVFLKAGSFSTTPPDEGTDLSVTKTDEPDPVTANGIVRYLVDVTNEGELDSGVTLTDSPSAGTIIAASGEGWTCDIVEGTAVCTLDAPLAAGASAPTVEVLVEAPGEAGTIENTATVTGDATDPDPEDNTFVETTTVEPANQDEVITFCPPTGCEFQTGQQASPGDNTINRVDVPAGGDGSITRIRERVTTFACGGNRGTGSDEQGQETNFVPPTGLVDPTNPIVVTTTWDVSVWPVHPGADPGTSNSTKAQGQVHICMQKVDEEGEPVGEVFRLPWCDVPGIASPAPCIDGASRNAQMDISVRILMLSPDPQWRR